MRLIDADELITAFPCGETVRTECVRATIKHMPTIEERKKGKWIREGSAFNLKCPYCRRFFAEPVGSKFNYCPSCGADMRGEENETD